MRMIISPFGQLGLWAPSSWVEPYSYFVCFHIQGQREPQVIPKRNNNNYNKALVASSKRLTHLRALRLLLSKHHSIAVNVPYRCKVTLHRCVFTVRVNVVTRVLGCESFCCDLPLHLVMRCAFLVISEIEGTPTNGLPLHL
jgi:hypothetical protein